MAHFVYLLKCADGSYYCGYSTDPERRVIEHNSSPKGARCTRARRPVKLVYTEELPTRGEALSREWHIKRLTHLEKEKLAEEYLAHQIPRCGKCANSCPLNEPKCKTGGIPKSFVFDSNYSEKFCL